MRAYLIVSSALLVAGCAAAPKVSQRLITTPGGLPAEAIASYALQDSIIILKPSSTGEGAKKVTKVVVETDRVDHQGTRIAILAHQRVGINTGLTIKNFDNTDIPSEVTVKVEDTRADLVKKVGEIAVAAIKLGVGAFSETADAELPARINVSEEIGNTADRNEIIRQVAKEKVRVVISPPAIDAIETTALNNSRPGPYFYYAACRTALISLRYGGEIYQFNVKVSDPNFLQRQRLPVDGKIVMHSQCGASVTGKMTGDDAASALAITSALVAQGQAISDAVKAAKEKDEE